MWLRATKRRALLSFPTTTEKIKNLFNGTGSYAYSVATKAAMTESYAKSEAAKSNTYTKNGTYNYNYNSGNIFTDMF